RSFSRKRFHGPHRNAHSRFKAAADGAPHIVQNGSLRFMADILRNIFPSALDHVIRKIFGFRHGAGLYAKVPFSISGNICSTVAAGIFQLILVKEMFVDKETFEKGLSIRKQVHGAEFVDNAFATADDLNW